MQHARTRDGNKAGSSILELVRPRKCILAPPLLGARKSYLEEVVPPCYVPCPSQNPKRNRLCDFYDKTSCSRPFDNANIVFK